MMSLVRDFRAVEERREMFRCVVVSFCQVRASHVGSREGTRFGGAAGGGAGVSLLCLELLFCTGCGAESALAGSCFQQY